MDNEEDVVLDSSPEEVVENVSEDEKTPTDSEPHKSEKTVPYSRFKEVNEELAKLKNQPPLVKTNLGVEDYIDISASLEGLDQREKQYLAEQHKLSGKPLGEIRKDEDFNLWQSAYRAKVEKEQLSLKPSGTQSESDKPMSFAQKLSNASVADKERILAEAGLYKSPRPRPDRVDLGRGK